MRITENQKKILDGKMIGPVSLGELRELARIVDQWLSKGGRRRILTANIHILMAAAGMNLIAVAKEANYDASTISRALAGKKRFEVLLLWSIGKALGVKPTTLLLANLSSAVAQAVAAVEKRRSAPVQKARRSPHR